MNVIEKCQLLPCFGQNKEYRICVTEDYSYVFVIIVLLGMYNFGCNVTCRFQVWHTEIKKQFGIMHYAFWYINCHNFFFQQSTFFFKQKIPRNDAWQRNRESVSMLCYVQNTTCMVICIENFSDWLTRGIWIVWSSSNVWMENYSTQNTLVQKNCFCYMKQFNILNKIMI